jgi:hypothetical protein
LPAVSSAYFPFKASKYRKAHQHSMHGISIRLQTLLIP